MQFCILKCKIDWIYVAVLLLEEMWKNFDDMLYYGDEELRKQVDDRLRKERDAEIEKEVTQKVTNKVTNVIALKMIKDNLSKEQVIKYCQLSDEEYETLKKMVFDK